jgi:phosphate transport system permease protein
MEHLDRLKQAGALRVHFNSTLLTRSDSTQPELAGLLGAIVGSAMTLLITALLAVPIGVMAAIYLEEFAPQNRFTDIVEVNINNLAAVPSIVYGLLGVAVFINWMGLPRASPLVGGLVLSLMALPTVIIATRSSLKAVPPSIREAALGVGASRTQMVFHHVSAAGHAGRDDGHHHRPGSRHRRDGAAAADRHGVLRAGSSGRSGVGLDRPAGADLHLGERRRTRFP